MKKTDGDNEGFDLLTLARLRCSVRAYTSRAVESEKLEYILEAVRLAPSAVNFQPWLFIVIQDEKDRKKLQQCYDRDWFTQAPVYIVACGDHRQSWKRKSDMKDFCDVDVAIAVEHLCLAATEQELGSCWVCNFDTKLCAEILNLPEYIEPLVLIPIGYPENPDVFASTPKKRKAFNEIVKWGKY